MRKSPDYKSLLKRPVMFDIKAIRENPDEFDALWAKRGLEPQSKAIIDKDKLIRKAGQVVQEAEAARNKASKQIGQAMAKGDKEKAEELKAAQTKLTKLLIEQKERKKMLMTEL